MKNAVVGVLMIFLLLGAFAEPIIDGVKTWRTTDTTETFNVETADVTAANVTLAYDLFQAVTAEVISVTSDNAGDTPVANEYTEATQVLNVDGLSENTTRVLTVNYYAESDNAVMQAIGPFLVVLIIGACVYFIVRGMFSKKRG